MRIEILDCGSADGIARLEAAWRDLQQAGGVSHPMYTWEWMSTWWEVFGQGRSLVALIARNDGQVAAVAPFVRRKARMNRFFSFRRLQLMGTGEDQEDEVYSEYVDMPARPGIGPEAADRLADELLSLDGKGKWDDVVLHRVDPNSTACRAFRASAKRKGLSATHLSEGKCPYVALPPTIGEYEQQLSSNRRQQLRRGIRELEKMGEIRSQKADTIPDALDALSHLASLHQARWMRRGESGAFAGDRFLEFHRHFIRRTFALGWPELWTLSAGDQRIAYLYNIRYQRRISFYQSGIEELQNNKVRPGMISHYFAIKGAIDSGATEYDFMLGESQYKVSMSNAARELVTLRISRDSVKETLRQAACSVVGRVRRLRAGAGGRRP